MKPKFVGFGLAKIEKSAWEESPNGETLMYCPYVWIIHTKMGLIDECKGKIDTFWRILSLSKAQRVGLKKGPYGYILRKGSSSWEGINEDEYNSMLSAWINEREED